MAVLSMLLGVTLYVAFLAASGWTAFVLVCRYLSGLRASGRLLVALAVTALLQHGLVGVIDAAAALGLHLFRWWFALPAVLALGAVTHRRLGGVLAVAALQRDLGAVLAAAREIWTGWPDRVLIAWGGVCAATRALAGLVSPPLTWDTLTYHAFKPAEWVQYGFRVRTAAPDQWGYLTYYPDAAAEPAAWALLFLRSDLGLPVVGIAQWTACGLAVYAVTRLLEVPRKTAFRASLLVAFLPALLGEMVSGYADMFVLFAFLALGCAVTLVLRPERADGGPVHIAEAVLVGGMAGLLASAKFSGVPIACVAVGATLLPRARWRLFTVSIVAALLVSSPHYLRVWLERGTPFHPYAVSLAGWQLSQGNQQLRSLFAGPLAAGESASAGALAFLQTLIVPTSPPKVEFAGFGPGMLLVVPLAIVGLFRSLLDRSGGAGVRLPIIVLMAMAGVPAVGILSQGYAGLLALWPLNVGRLLLPLPAALAVFGALFRSRLAGVYLYAAAALTLALAWPAGVVGPLQAVLLSFLPWAVATVVLTVIAIFAVTRRQPLVARKRWLLTLVLLPTLLVVAPLVRLRADARYALYAAAAGARPPFIMHASSPRYSAAWPLWQAVDDGQPHRIAAAFGWDAPGHNGFRYPLLGTRLQNRVSYVPITRDGSLIDYQRADRLRDQIDENAWLGRLDEAAIDLVFLGEPPPPESELVRRHPERFRLVGHGQDGLGALYRVTR